MMNKPGAVYNRGRYLMIKVEYFSLFCSLEKYPLLCNFTILVSKSLYETP